MLFSYHLLYFCTVLSLIIMLSSHYHHHKSKTFSQLTQCPFTGTLLLLIACSQFTLLSFEWDRVGSDFNGRVHGYSCRLSQIIVVFTGGIRLILGLAFATPPCVEIFGVNSLRGKLHQLGSPNLQDIFIVGEASLGRKLASF